MKNVFFRLSVAGLALSLLGSGCWPSVVHVPPAPPQTQVPNATSPDVDTTKPLAYLKLNGGTASITRGDSTVPGQDDVELLAGDRVQVSAGTVSLIYPDAGETQIDAGSDVTLLSDGPDTGSVFDELQVAAGNVWTRFERLLGPNEHFSVQANGVVATVRGTGFGVSVNGDDVDIQVAEHTVDITSADEEASASTYPSNAMRVMAGQEVHMIASNFKKMGPGERKALVKDMSKADMKKKGYQFGSNKISPGQLKKPLKPVKLKVAPGAMPAPLLQRIELLKREMTVEAQLKGFVAPTIAPGSLTPVGTPTTNGPTSTIQ